MRTFGGVNSCPYDDDSAIAVGDVNGGGEPDFAVGAPDFTETDATSRACARSVPGHRARLHVPRRGHHRLVADPVTEATDPAALTITSRRDRRADPPLRSVARSVGDIGRCSRHARPGPPDTTCVSPRSPSPTSRRQTRPGGRRARRGLPGAADAGAVFLLDPAANAAMTTRQSTEVTTAAAFGSFDQSFPAAGNLGAAAGPDVLVATPSGGGGAIAYSGDPFGPSRFGFLADPAPATGGAFAAVTAGSATSPATRRTSRDRRTGWRAGRRRPHREPVCQRRAEDHRGPGQRDRRRFGAAIAPIGDRNADGFIDLAVGAPLSGGGAGRVYVFTSSGPAAVGFAGCTPRLVDRDPPAGPRRRPRRQVSARVLRRLALVPSKRRLGAGRPCG